MQCMYLLTILSVASGANLRFLAAAPCSGDEAILSTNKFSCDAVTCAKKNFFGIKGTAKCMVAMDKVSESCATCFGEVAQCSATHCALKCLADPESDKCQECGHKNCDKVAKTCVPDGTNLPPNPKNCKSFEVAMAKGCGFGCYQKPEGCVDDCGDPCTCPKPAPQPSCPGCYQKPDGCVDDCGYPCSCPEATADATPTAPENTEVAMAKDCGFGCYQTPTGCVDDCGDPCSCLEATADAAPTAPEVYEEDTAMFVTPENTEVAMAKDCGFGCYQTPTGCVDDCGDACSCPASPLVKAATSILVQGLDWLSTTLKTPSCPGCYQKPDGCVDDCGYPCSCLEATADAAPENTEVAMAKDCGFGCYQTPTGCVDDCGDPCSCLEATADATPTAP